MLLPVLKPTKLAFTPCGLLLRTPIPTLGNQLEQKVNDTLKNDHFSLLTIQKAKKMRSDQMSLMQIPVFGKINIFSQVRALWGEWRNRQAISTQAVQYLMEKKKSNLGLQFTCSGNCLQYLIFLGGGFWVFFFGLSFNHQILLNLSVLDKRGNY